MLCPVCKKRDLEGRQLTCSPACRSAQYRDRKRKRDVSQARDTQPALGRSSGHRPERECRPASSPNNVEQLISSAVHRIVAAIQQQGSQAAQPPSAWRLDMREQVTSQAPEQAVGYRLVLLGRDGDRPRLVPARSRTRDTARYTLDPFEYPDDLRLRDGCWYRIVWMDAEGRRILPKPGEPVPGLYFFVGPSSSMLKAALPAVDSPPESHPLQAPAPPPTAVPGEVLRDTVSDPPLASPPADSPQPATAMSPARPSETTEAAFLKLLSEFPKLPLEEWTAVYGFVMQVPWMIWLLWEERRRQAVASGLPVAQKPAQNLSAREREAMRQLARTAPPYFIALCKRLFLFLQDHGTDVLTAAPVPFHPLPDEQRQVILRAIRNSSRRAYMAYICHWQDALLHQHNLPSEPQSELRSEQRRELRKCLVDLRAVLLFKQQAAAFGA